MPILGEPVVTGNSVGTFLEIVRRNHFLSDQKLLKIGKNSHLSAIVGGKRDTFPFPLFEGTPPRVSDPPARTG